MLIYNTMTRRKEELTPIKQGEISMYVCGPTVYNFIHVGNARPLIVFDTLRRYLEYKGYKVTFVQNFTDIDDKLIRRAAEEGCSVQTVADRYIAEYYTDARALHVSDATFSPHATEHIGDIIGLIQRLIDMGYAYAADNGDVYFSVRSYPSYGRLTGQSIESLESGARIDPAEQKRDPLDFALWKGRKPGEPYWEAPWGEGRPGWHIECSAMSMRLLGETFDIHAGGQDLMFPHHENEIAQSEAATGRPFARYWMHNGYINVNNQKMSKSLGNFRTVRDIVSEFEPDALRLFMLSAHYRSPINFSRELMEQAETACTRIRTARERLAEARVSDAPDTKAEGAFIDSLNVFSEAFIRAMDDDLNTADAIGTLFELIRACNTFVTEPRSAEAVKRAQELFDELAGVLGIETKTRAEFPEAALNLLNERAAARGARDWARADAIRDELKAMGFAVEDSPQGAKLKPLA